MQTQGKRTVECKCSSLGTLRVRCGVVILQVLGKIWGCGGVLESVSPAQLPLGPLPWQLRCVSLQVVETSSFDGGVVECFACVATPRPRLSWQRPR